jgi:hypothetical protein
VHRYGTHRVYGARKCLIIKLFGMKSALISFHNISVLQGALVREKSAEITLIQTRWYFGAVPFWAR